MAVGRATRHMQIEGWSTAAWTANKVLPLLGLTPIDVLPPAWQVIRPFPPSPQFLYHVMAGALLEPNYSVWPHIKCLAYFKQEFICPCGSKPQCVLFTCLVMCYS